MGKIIVAGSVMPVITKCPGILSRREFTVVPAESAEEILAVHESAGADLIIVDSDMPAMGGEALCFLLRKKVDLKKVSIIAISDGTDQGAERLEACGANAVVGRPVDPDYLDGKIRELLNVDERENMREVVKVSVSITSENKSFFAVSKNVSISGLLFETNRVLSMGLLVTCSFVLQHQLTVHGKIVRVSERSEEMGRGYEYGIQFTQIEPAVEAEIARYVTGGSLDAS
jgi:CheY-like chemotaxis protein